MIDFSGLDPAVVVAAGLALLVVIFALAGSLPDVDDRDVEGRRSSLDL